ncbi:glycosyltransferase family 2 protein [Ferrovum myxofaciens]|uniref:Glycosyltransferase family 2 protein n=2 Tax=Ferrovum myxofaciens TaxID=416213 RepID=A0A9E6MZV8_9PROT|nr:glycosyltransferase family 2 protein [Ferrovum myxofaciens]QKE39161.1 MAG: glycosyltransferase family 2 protein [Ferrovum myxofaciens]QWY74406.1 MAG: glycosyltransferase family 2 protein [Ferrovum myxofaciens]QWY78874.1 MAG: glycosyltransferase family 2 protein [Ferrovum myxofaciens]
MTIYNPIDRFLLSVVVPAYNEEDVLPEFHRRLTEVFQLIEKEADCEVIYVNDGSTDGTMSIIDKLKENDSRVGLVDLSRNFGKEIAMTAGFDHALGDAIVIIDSDLQDPPELIPDLISAWKRGYDVVYAKRLSREGETMLKKLTAYAFYRIAGQLGRVTIPSDTGDFRLLSRRALDSLLTLREQHRFMKGLFAWIGYPQISVPYRRDPRFAGETKWNYWKLWNFALEGITSFSIFPLKIATYFGLFFSILAFLFAFWIIIKTLIFGDPVRGYPTVMVTILFFGGIQIFSVGILGEYVGRMFNESKNRPLYFTNRYSPSVQSLEHNEFEKTGQKNNFLAP